MSRSELRARARQQLGGSIFATPWLLALVACLLVSAATSISGVVFVGPLLLIGPLQVGMASFFLSLARGSQNVDMERLLDGFKKDVGGNLLLGLLYSIFLALWSLLFVIPGIVKAYAYSLCFYLKNDHPDYDWKKSLDESQRLMKGHKMELFLLDLSFLGWIIVGSICCGIGVLWVYPYMATTRANFYEGLLQTQG
jgi:uncharacterized membrane protein